MYVGVCKLKTYLAQFCFSVDSEVYGENINAFLALNKRWVIEDPNTKTTKAIFTTIVCWLVPALPSPQIVV